MLRAITHKLTSKHGASLSMALMLMLVCTTVAGIALTAATVVAGRHSRLEDLDSSFYNVTSAASVFWDELDGLKTNPTEIVRTCDATPTGTTGLSDPTSISVVFDGSDNVPTNATLFQKISCDLVFGRVDNDLTKERVVTDTMFVNSINLSTGDVKETTVSETPYDSFEVKVGSSKAKVTVTPRQDGSVEFLFSEDKDPSTTCTIVASASITNTTVIPSDNHYRWETSVVWTPMYMNVGGAA